MPIGAQFIDAMPCDLLKHSLAARKKRNQNAAPVVAAAIPPDVTMRLQPIDQFHCAVMFERQPLGDRSHRGFFALRQPADREKQQVLLGLKTDGARNGVSFAQKMPDSIAKLG
jgi:hypothetical protein